MTLRGRCISIRDGILTLRNAAGEHEMRVTPGDARPGDVVEVGDGRARVLTPNRTAERTSSWTSRILDPRRRHGVSRRGQVESSIREFFESEGFIETRTPLMVRSPGMEPHIRPFRLETGAYLPTSPEFAMKRLLAGGLERIFQIGPAFRLEPTSTTHHPEFTMLEWYRAYAGYEDIMSDAERLIERVATRLFGAPVVPWQGREISVKAPWPRLRVRDLFRDHAGVDLVAASTPAKLRAECRRLSLTTSDSDTWDDLYFRIWLNVVEPALPADRAVLVTRYPASQAALAVIDSDEDGSRWARRFEIYAGGLELGNAFEELTDPVEQRRRFVEDMELRARIYGPEFPPSPIDEEFLQALEEGMPPSGGIAVGVDRLVMLFADEPDIEFTQWLPSHVPG